MSKKKPKKKHSSKKKQTTPKNTGKKPASQKKKIVKKQKEEKAKTPSLLKGKQGSYLLGAAALLLILTFFAYQPALDNDFVDWDDYTYVIDNELVRSEKASTGDIFSRVISLNYHPLTILSMQMNNNECKDCINGISARPFILWNLIFHLVNSALVFLFIFLISKKNWFIAGFTALAFALHPMHVESVAWVSERKDVLYVFFFMLGLLSYNRHLHLHFTKKEGQSANFTWLGLALAFFLFACLSKAMAVVFPLVMMLLYFWKTEAETPFMAIKKLFRPRPLLEILPFFAIALYFGMMAMSVQSGGDFNGLLDNRSNSAAINTEAFNLLEKSQFAAYGFWNYIFKFFVPIDLHTFHPYPSRQEFNESSIYLFSLIGFIILIAGVIISLRKFRFIAFGMGFYFVTVALVLQFLSVGQVVTAERYTYLPYVGLAFLVAYALYKWVPKSLHVGLYGLAAVAAIAWFIQTRSQVETWQDSEALWGNVIDIYGNNNKIEYAFSVRGNFRGKMADYWQRNKNPQKANEFLKEAEQDFQIAIKMNTKQADVYEGMGNIYGLRSQQQNDASLTQKALEMYNKAIEYNPNKASSYINRGIAHSTLGQHQKALADMETAAKLEPSNPKYLWYRGIARQVTGDRAGAIQDFQQTVRLDPENQDAKNRLQQLQGN